METTERRGGGTEQFNQSPTVLVCAARVCALDNDGRPWKTVGETAGGWRAPVVSIATVIFGITIINIKYVFFLNQASAHERHLSACFTLVSHAASDTKPQPAFFPSRL